MKHTLVTELTIYFVEITSAKISYFFFKVVLKYSNPRKLRQNTLKTTYIIQIYYNQFFYDTLFKPKMSVYAIEFEMYCMNLVTIKC